MQLFSCVNWLIHVHITKLQVLIAKFSLCFYTKIFVAILVDNLREISTRTIVVKEQNILAPLNGIRAPMTPQILEERPPHISEDDILRQYHRELDCYVEFSFVVSHSKCQDMALLMIDMFVLPSIQRAISKTSFHEVWISFKENIFRNKFLFILLGARWSGLASGGCDPVESRATSSCLLRKGSIK